jgi:hypothetical protein
MLDVTAFLGGEHINNSSSSSGKDGQLTISRLSSSVNDG